VGKPEGKRAFGRPRRKWDDKIEIYMSSGSGMCGYRLGKAGL